MLKIKNPRAHELAREIADRTGESLTDAVIHSLEERLERTKATSRKASKAEILKTISEMRAGLPPGFFEEEDPTGFLYHPETGLPA